MARSYSELQDKDDITALALGPYGLGRATMSRAGWSPVGVKMEDIWKRRFP
jgi:hypothetical protein